MARIRTLKPEILEDDKTAGLSDGAFRMFTAMIVLADDHGNLRANAGWLIGQIWWARNESPRVAELLREVAEADLIHVYMVRGQLYCHIRSWEKHQRIDNRGKARVPTPKDAEGQGNSVLPPVDCGISPKSAEEFRETPPDLRPPTSEKDPDPEGERRPRGKPRSRALAQSREVEIPSDWEPTPEHAVLAEERGVSLAGQAKSFRLHAETHARRAVRWNAAFTQWLLKAFPDRRNASGDGLQYALDVANGVIP